MRHDRSGIPGGIIERELIGKSMYESKGGEPGHEFTYRTYEQSLRLVKEMQPFDPTRPTPEFAYMVRRLIFKELELTDEQELRFYTAVGSALDLYHGVDGWFEITRAGHEVRATIDMTKNDLKDTGYKADITFLVPDAGLDRKLDRDEFIRYAINLARKVVEIFGERGIAERKMP